MVGVVDDETVVDRSDRNPVGRTGESSAIVQRLHDGVELIAADRPCCVRRVEVPFGFGHQLTRPAS